MIHISNEVFMMIRIMSSSILFSDFIFPSVAMGKKCSIPLGVSSHGKVDYDYGPNLPMHQRQIIFSSRGRFIIERLLRLR